GSCCLSSRGRHTRFSRDWSSDVCSSDLLVEREPNYSLVSARLLMDRLRAEALSFLGIAESATQADMSELYPRALPAYISRGIERSEERRVGQARRAPGPPHLTTRPRVEA